MARRNKAEIDLEDLIPAQIFAIMALVQFGIVDFVAYDGELDLAQTYAFGGYDLSLAFILGAASLAIIAITNELSADDVAFWDDSSGTLDQTYGLAVAGTAALIVLVEFSTTVNDFVTGSDVVATLAFLAAAIAVWAIVWVK